MTLLPKVKLKALVSFPAEVRGGTGITVTKENGVYTLDIDPDEIGPLAEAPADGQLYGRDGLVTSWQPTIFKSGDTIAGVNILSNQAHRVFANGKWHRWRPARYLFLYQLASHDG